MIEAPHFSAAGTRNSSAFALPADYFDGTVHEHAMHQAVRAFLNNQRQGTHQTKSRSFVSGGNQKPWKQKGTGRARQGTTRAPHWKGGGVVFGPHPRSYEQKMPRKMRHLALKSALAAKAQENQIKVVDEFSLDAPKTRDMKAILDSLQAKPSALILLPAGESPVARSAHNLAKVKTLRTGYLNVRDLLGFEYVVMSKAALTAIEAFFGEPQTENIGQGDTVEADDKKKAESAKGKRAANGGK